MCSPLPQEPSSSQTAEKQDAAWLSEVLHLGCFTLKRLASIVKGKISVLPENNNHRILEMQILVFTYIHSCKYRSWPRNFIQLSNLPLTSTVFYYIWTKTLSGFAFEQYPPFDFKWDCCIIKTPKSCQFVQTRFQIFLIFSFSNTESNTAKHFINILLCSHFD